MPFQTRWISHLPGGLSTIEHHGANQSIHRFQRMRWSSEASWIQIALASLLGISKTGAPSGGWQSAAEGKMISACLSILAWLKIEGADQSNHSRWHLVGMVDSSHNLKKRTWISAVVPFISPLDPFWLRSRVKSSWRLNSPSWPLKWVTERIRDGRPRPWQSIEYLDILGILGDLWLLSGMWWVRNGTLSRFCII